MDEWVTVPRKMTKEMKKTSGIWQDPWDIALDAAPKPEDDRIKELKAEVARLHGFIDAYRFRLDLINRRLNP